MAILNLTQHQATPQQIEQGVIEPQNKAFIQEMLTFVALPDAEELNVRAEKLAEFASGHEAALIGGAPYLMSALEHHLKRVGVKPLYSWSERKSIEVHKEDGSVEKRNVFEHKGFVEVP